MGVTRNINISITGQVPDDYQDNEYEILIAKLEVICAEYKLELEENSIPKQELRAKDIELPDRNGPLGWIMSLNNEGELTIHEGSGLSYQIQEAFGVIHNKNVFIQKEEK